MTKRELFSLCFWRHCSLLLRISYGIIERLTRIFFLFQHFLHKSQYHLTQPKESCTIQRWHIIIFLKTALSFCISEPFPEVFCYQSHPEFEHQQILLSKQELPLLRCQGVATGNRLPSLTSSSSQLIAIQVGIFIIREIRVRKFIPSV